jgi:hypothetical protein
MQRVGLSGVGKGKGKWKKVVGLRVGKGDGVSVVGERVKGGGKGVVLIIKP